MRILVVTNMLPSDRNPRAGTFIEQQIQSLIDTGLDLEVLLIDRPTSGPLSYTQTISRVRERLNGNRFDLVHFMYGGMLAYLGLKASRGVPSVVSFCGVDLLGANYGPIWYRIRTAIGKLASHSVAHKADQIIVKSRNLEQGLPAGIDHSKVSIVPNGINLSRFRPMNRSACKETLGWTPERFQILFSTTDRKDTKKRLVLAEQAVDVLSRRGIDAEIHGLWRIPHDRVPIWMNAADVVLLTSRHDEGSPNIIKEALACNRPVVSVDVGDVAERVEGIDGCYITEATPDDIAEGLQRVVDGPRVVDGRTRMKELSLERVAERVNRVYRSAIQDGEGEQADSDALNKSP